MTKDKADFYHRYMLRSEDCGHCCDIGTYETKLYTAIYYFCPRGCVQSQTALVWNREHTCWMH